MNTSQHQHLEAWPANTEHYYSLVSAVTFSSVRLALGCVRVGAFLSLYRGRHDHAAFRRAVRRVIVLEAASDGLARIEEWVDRKFQTELEAAQRSLDSGAISAPPRAPDPGERFVRWVESQGDRLLGYETSADSPALPVCAPECVLLRPFAPGRRFLLAIAPFTTADREPLSKWPELEVSLYRLVSAFGGRFTTFGVNEALSGSPRLGTRSDWKQDVEEHLNRAHLILIVPFFTEGLEWELHLILRKNFLDKTIFLMPSAILPNSFARTAPGVLSKLMYLLLRLWTRVITSDPPGIEFTRSTDFLSVVLEDPDLEGEWKEAQLDVEAATGLVLPDHRREGAAFIYCGDPRTPLVLGALGSIWNPDLESQDDHADLLDKIAALCEKTGGNPRSIVFVLRFGERYDHLAPFISAVVERLAAAYVDVPPGS